MDILCRSILFEGKAIVTAIDCTETVEKARRIHNTSPSATKALGRALLMGAFMSAGFKGLGNKLTLIIDGHGEGGKIVICGDCGALVRGHMEFPQCFAGEPAHATSEVVGRDGTLTVIKDFHMKEPYNGTVRLLNGSIDNDFAYYFTVSEQLPSAVATGVSLNDDGSVKAAGAIVVQPMPNCTDDIIVVLQDIMKNFTNMDELVAKKTPEQIIDDNFGHFDIKHLEPMHPDYVCNCSEKRIEDMIRTLGKKEADEIVKEQGAIEVTCEFCRKKYVFTQAAVDKIFKEN